MNLPALIIAVVVLASCAAFAAEGARPAEAPATRPATTAPARRPQCLIETSLGSIRVELRPDAAPVTVAKFAGLAEGRLSFIDEKTGKEVTRPFYDGLTFHRVIAEFMIQGGCPKGDGTGGPGWRFEDEINADGLGLGKIKVITPQGQPHPWLLIRTQADWSQNVTGPLLRKMGIQSQEQFEARAEEVKKRLNELTLKQAYENLGYRYDAKLTALKPVRGVIAMANAGPNTNGSQFFITVADAPWLTGKHTVFGKVVAGMDVVDRISKLEVAAGGKPATPVRTISIRVVPAAAPTTAPAPKGSGASPG